MKGVMPGVEGETKFTVNSYGLRGPELPSKLSDNNYIILFVGGSTTECGYLDDYDAFPYLVMENLNNISKKYNIIAENAGKSGHKTRNHIILLRYLLSRVKVSCVIILCGGNDLILMLRNGSDPNFMSNPQSVEKVKNQTFWNLSYQASPADPFYKKTRIWQLLKRIKMFYSQRVMIEDKAGKQYIERREKAQKAEKVKLDSAEGFRDIINNGLLEYEKNIKEIINICREHKVRLIFINQPALNRENLPYDFEKLLWVGKIDFLSKKGKDVYIAQEDCARILDMYNTVLRSVCVENNVEFIDLASNINQDLDNFYDDGHFNKKGARKVAEIITDYLKDKLP
jgi:lysophospholipase L1-like esterase